MDEILEVHGFPYIDHCVLEFDDLSYARQKTYSLLEGTRVEESDYEGAQLELLRDGAPMDFQLSAYRVPIVSENAASLFREFAQSDVQLLGPTMSHGGVRYFLLNVVRRFDAYLGPSSSSGDMDDDLRFWTSFDLQGASIFRVGSFPERLFISGKFKDKMISRRLTGPVVSPVLDDAVFLDIGKP